MEFKDYYAILGVPKTATDDEIKRAYRKLARTHHPDLNPGDKTAEAKFKELNEANEVLGDPEKRRKYDELGANWRMYEHQQPPRPPGGFAPGPGGGFRSVTPEEMEELLGGSGFSDFFSTFFGGEGPARTGGRRARAHRPRRGPDVEAVAEITLEEAFSGTSRRVSVTRGGKEHTVEIRIPAGVHEGARIRAAGEGSEGTSGGGAGDLFIEIHVLPHPRFELRGLDLHTRVGVPVTTAVLGGEVTFPSLSGSTLRLRIPEMTAAGRVFRLRAHGMPDVRKSGERGDLYVTAEIQIPSSITPEEKQHYEALRALADAHRQNPS